MGFQSPALGTGVPSDDPPKENCESWLLLASARAFTSEPPNDSAPAVSQAVSPAKADTIDSATPATGTKRARALILCGLSGDAAHHKLFAETVSKLHAGLSNQLGFAAADVRVLFGDEPLDSDSEPIKSARRATRVELEKTVAELRKQVRTEDALWVIVLGHSHYDGRHSWLNLPGPDIQQTEFAKLFADLTAQEQVFFITTPTSGFSIKPLTGKGRVVITATEADWETNETEFPHELARVLSSPPEAKEFDIDQDGAITLFDLYVTVARNLAQSYLERELLATEHPLLDDNGDGRGTEVQIDFLAVEQGGRASPRKPSPSSMSSSSDGRVSKSIPLSFARTAAAQPTAE